MIKQILTSGLAKQTAEQELRKLEKNEEFDFNLAHTKLVVKTALILAKSTGKNIDFEALEIAGWLHDIGKAANKDNHAEQSIEIIEKLGYNINETIKDCILNHGTKNQPNTEEGRILQLADKLSTISPEIVEVLLDYSLKKDKESKEHDLEFIRKLANQGIDLLKDFE